MRAPWVCLCQICRMHRTTGREVYRIMQRPTSVSFCCNSLSKGPRVSKECSTQLTSKRRQWFLMEVLALKVTSTCYSQAIPTRWASDTRNSRWRTCHKRKTKTRTISGLRDWHPNLIMKTNFKNCSNQQWCSRHTIRVRRTTIRVYRRRGSSISRTWTWPASSIYRKTIFRTERLTAVITTRGALIRTLQN